MLVFYWRNNRINSTQF